MPRKYTRKAGSGNSRGAGTEENIRKAEKRIETNDEENNPRSFGLTRCFQYPEEKRLVRQTHLLESPGFALYVIWLFSSPKKWIGWL